MSDDIFDVNGWTIYAHPLFLDQLEAMIAAVEKARKKDPTGYKKKRAAKLLAAVLKVAFEDIPAVLSLPAVSGRENHRPRLGER